MLNIIVPTYKAKKTLPDLLDSLVAQTEKKFFVTLVQDCDDENYSDIIEEYKRRGLHISLLSTKVNSGPGVARQVGIDASQMFEYIMFIDSDDIIYPRAVELLYKNARAENFDVLSSKFETNNSITNKSIDFNMTWLHGKIYRTKFLKENNIRFRDDVRMNEDVYFNILTMLLAKKVGQIDTTTYFWRKNKNSLTHNIKDKNKETYGYIDNINYANYFIKDKIKEEKIIKKLGTSLIAIYNILCGEFLDINKLSKESFEKMRELYKDYTFNNIMNKIENLEFCKKVNNEYIFFDNNIQVWFNNLKEKLNA